VNLEWCLHDSVLDAHDQWLVRQLLKLEQQSAVWLLLLELRIVFGHANVFLGAHGARNQPRHLFSEPKPQRWPERPSVEVGRKKRTNTGKSPFVLKRSLSALSGFIIGTPFPLSPVPPPAPSLLLFLTHLFSTSASLVLTFAPFRSLSCTLSHLLVGSIHHPRLHCRCVSRMCLFLYVFVCVSLYLLVQKHSTGMPIPGGEDS